MEGMKLRAGKEKDIPRLRVLLRDLFPARGAADAFLQTYFVPGRVENSLVLLDGGGVQSALFFLPTYYYDGEKDDYSPAPYLIWLTTAEEKRRRGYAGWLVETACDFLREKGAGGVWTLMPAGGGVPELFFVRRGFWRVGRDAQPAVAADGAFPAVRGTIRRAAAREYDAVREQILRGRSHIVYGAATVSFLQDNIMRRGGGLFVMEKDGVFACAAAYPGGDGTVRVCELLCDGASRLEAAALLDGVFHAASYASDDMRYGYMMRFRDMPVPDAPRVYLGCGVLL